ncbi:MAG: NAD(+)/NADH kinase [Halieaceae bacterium]|jgi:predicted polyphosphate/ATP-dependent NAD kinase|nr:NAD(+)/NADH kinase [Halieaceae bacterium]
MTPAPRRIALIINPKAGLGGAVGLKGSDGDRAERALAAGAAPRAGHRAEVVVDELLRLPVEWFAAGGAMGGDLLASRGLSFTPLHDPGEPSTGEDTRAAVARACSQRVDLILFVGGDGTARDVLAAIDERTVVLGIPAGVKMHSAVFALSPRSAGRAAREFVQGGCAPRFVDARAVMDRDFDAQGNPVSSPSLYGYVNCLAMPSLMQAAKASGASADNAALLGALPRLARELRDFDRVILGPGATLAALKRELGFDGTLLGVDVHDGAECILRDAREDQIWDAIQGRRSCLVLGVIGGQGFLLGRGNQQLSPRILAQLGRESLRVLASADKLAGLAGGRLYVDTGEDATDHMLAGYLPVITGPRQRIMCEVVAAV